jgi:hypothetical protein
MARGPLTEALFAVLCNDPDSDSRVDIPVGMRPADDPLFGDDAALGLYCLYELHYRGFADISAHWEWHPGLLRWRRRLEELLVERLVEEVGNVPHDATIPDDIRQLLDGDDQPSLAQYLLDKGTPDLVREAAIHRSAWQLKEADPYTWAIPRLAGYPKAAAVEIQADEYGGGVTRDMHQNLFGVTMLELGLDPSYNAYLSKLPGTSLAAVNVVSMFGLHRRWLGACIGHLALFEMTSVEPMGLNEAALRRLGFGADARHFYSVHVVADALHQSVAADQLAHGLIRQEPALAGQVLFGAKTVMTLESKSTAAILDAWAAGRSSLLSSGHEDSKQVDPRELQIPGNLVVVASE